MKSRPSERPRSSATSASRPRSSRFSNTSGICSARPDSLQEARVRQLGLDPVLLEEHPLEHAGAGEPVGGEVLRALGEVGEDGAGLRDRLPVVQLQDRDAAVRVAAEVLGRARLAGEEVDGDALEGDFELPQQDARLHAIARGGMVVQDHARNLACRVCGEEWQPRPPFWSGWWVARPQPACGRGGAGAGLDHDRPPPAGRADQRPDGRPRPRPRRPLERANSPPRAREHDGPPGECCGRRERRLLRPERRPGGRPRDRRRAPERARGRPVSAPRCPHWRPRSSRRSVTGGASR